MLYIARLGDMLVGWLPNIGEALLVLIIGLFVIKFVARIAGGMLAAGGVNTRIIKTFSNKNVVDPDGYMTAVIYRILMFMLLLTFLGALGAGWAAGMLGGAGLVVVVVFLLVLSLRTDFFSPPTSE